MQMATCKDCIHYSVCMARTHENTLCDHFKNKADVVPVVRKSVKGYEGYYEVDQFGRVFSVDRVISVNDNGRQYNKPLKAKQMKQHMHTNGYKVVSLTKDGKSKGLFVHRIVAEAFIENPNNLPMVNHKDEDRTNNFVENLEWCTVAYNNTYGNAQKKKAKKLKGVPHTEEHKEKISSSLKRYYKQNPIMQFEYNGRMFSIPELSKELNIPQETLRARYRRTGSVFLCSYGERKDK